jgi:hypothetical protein
METFAKPFCGWPIRKPCKQPPIGSTQRSFASNSTTGLGWWDRSSPSKTAKPSTWAVTTPSNKWSTANFIFRRNFPIHKLFERSCDLGLLRLTADKISQMFGFRLSRRMRGNLSTVLERMEHGHHVLRACAKNAVLRMYEKFSTFLRIEALSNNLRDFGLHKSLDNLETVRQTLANATDRFADFQAQAMDPALPALSSADCFGSGQDPRH